LTSFWAADVAFLPSHFQSSIISSIRVFLLLRLNSSLAILNVLTASSQIDAAGPESGAITPILTVLVV
jgi:hypothetical protein